MKKLLNWIGLFTEPFGENPYSYSSEEYTQSNDKDKTRTHRDFLRLIEEEENNRLNLLETKTSQLVSQTGIVFSLLSLFIPFFIDKISDESLILKIGFLLILLAAFGSYILTIHHAIKNYNVKEYIYSKPSPANVIKYQNESIVNFDKIEVQDLLYSINHNQKTNNKKADNLIYSYRAFKMGNIATAFLVGILCYSLLFVRKEAELISIGNPIKIEEPIRIKDMDSLTIRIIEAVKQEQIDKLRQADRKHLIDSLQCAKKHCP